MGEDDRIAALNIIGNHRNLVHQPAFYRMCGCRRPADIKPALDEIFEQESGSFELQTTRLTRYQFKVLVALAKLGGRNVYSSEFMSAAEVPSSGTATKALQRLVADGLVFVHDKEYRFFNPFLRAWLISKGY